MPHRDPETGQFVADGEQFDSIEQFSTSDAIEADPSGNLGADFPNEARWDGHVLIDYDEIVDRHEELHLLKAQHHLSVYVQGNGAVPGTVRGTVEISTGPTRQVAGRLTTRSGDPGDLETTNATAALRLDKEDDSIDLVGRVLSATAATSYQDFSSADGWGTGGSGSAGSDSVTLEGFPEQVARFHPRDELFLNGVLEAEGVDVQMFAEVNVQHWYGVIEG